MRQRPNRRPRTWSRSAPAWPDLLPRSRGSPGSRCRREAVNPSKRHPVARQAPDRSPHRPHRLHRQSPYRVARRSMPALPSERAGGRPRSAGGFVHDRTLAFPGQKATDDRQQEFLRGKAFGPTGDPSMSFGMVGISSRPPGKAAIHSIMPRFLKPAIPPRSACPLARPVRSRICRPVLWLARASIASRRRNGGWAVYPRRRLRW